MAKPPVKASKQLQFQVQLEGAWKPFQADVEAVLEREYSEGRHKAKVLMYGQEYEMDFRKLLQKNLKTGKIRPLRVSAGKDAVSDQCGRIDFQVLQGRGLLNTEVHGNMDPYCRVTVGLDVSQTGVCKDGGSNPVWQDDLGKAPVIHWDESKVMRIEVMDEDTGTASEGFSCSHDFVGECYLHIPYLARRGSFKGWLPVYRQGTTVHGEIEVSIQCAGVTDMDEAREIQQLVVAPAKMYRNRTAGIVNLLEGGSLAMFKTYIVALHGVAAAFQDEYCCDYDKEHEVVFSKTAQGLALRTSFTAQHASLFRESSIYPGHHVEMFTMLNSGDFLRMIKGGLRDGNRRVYTYVILDEGWFFSETGIQVGKDTLSKHVVLANAAAKVRFAGTFRLCMDSDDAPVLVFDNDSGTYRPNGTTIPIVEHVLGSNLPGLGVKGLNVLQPQPEDTLTYRGPHEKKGEPNVVYNGNWVWASEAAPSNAVAAT
mmetsp:Transcript_48074/g.88573  ORF Transcript_48074/g.88573 Transcript_48074/m.88573 type:complete len:482 (-) Transcript_48074:150-1595(-)